jgi:hypothetical protein
MRVAAVVVHGSVRKSRRLLGPSGARGRSSMQAQLWPLGGCMRSARVQAIPIGLPGGDWQAPGAPVAVSGLAPSSTAQRGLAGPSTAALWVAQGPGWAGAGGGAGVLAEAGPRPAPASLLPRCELDQVLGGARRTWSSPPNAGHGASNRPSGCPHAAALLPRCPSSPRLRVCAGTPRRRAQLQ